MLGVVVIAGSIYFLDFMYVYGTEMFTEQRHRRVFLERAQQKMERLRFLDRIYGGVVPIEENRQTTDTLVIRSDNGIVTIYADCDVRVIPSSLLDPSGRSISSEVRVIYTWREPTGRDYEITLGSNF